MLGLFDRPCFAPLFHLPVRWMTWQFERTINKFPEDDHLLFTCLVTLFNKGVCVITSLSAYASRCKHNGETRHWSYFHELAHSWIVHISIGQKLRRTDSLKIVQLCSTIDGSLIEKFMHRRQQNDIFLRIPTKWKYIYIQSWAGNPAGAMHP